MPGVTQGRIATHIVLGGKLKYNAYEDGNVLRCVATDKVVAKRKNSEAPWSRPVARIKPPNPAAVGRGHFDHIKSLGGPAVWVQLDKGQYYYAPELVGVEPRAPKGSSSSGSPQSSSHGSSGKSGAGSHSDSRTGRMKVPR